MGLDMKKFFVVISLLLGSLSYTPNTAIAKNDTVIISNEYKAMKFNACFSTEFCNHAKSDISKIMSDDPDNYTSIFAGIKSLVVNNHICNVEVHIFAQIQANQRSFKEIIEGLEESLSLRKKKLFYAKA